MNNLDKEFVPYAQALELKELGFDEPCFGYYKHTTIPNRIIPNNLIIGFIKDNRIYNDVSNGSSLVGLGKGLIFAPTFSQAFRWFREKYNINTVICWREDLLNYDSSLTEMKKRGYFYYKGNYNSYEEAELACLSKLSEIVKGK